MFGEGRVGRWSLTAQRRHDAEFGCGGNDLADGIEHRCVGFVEHLGADPRVAVDAQHQLGQVAAADEHAVDAQADVLRQPVHHRRHLGHHPPVQSALCAQRAGVDQRQALLEFPLGCARTESSA